MDDKSAFPVRKKAESEVEYKTGLPDHSIVMVVSRQAGGFSVTAASAPSEFAAWRKR
jgi:hypothetical protein